jgi:hypothetical protein
VARARYLSMNNVRAQSAQRSPSFGRYALRAKQRWRRRNGRARTLGRADVQTNNGRHDVWQRVPVIAHACACRRAPLETAKIRLIARR